MADWQKIKTEYITTDTSYRKLAEKYGVSRVQIGNVGKEEGWVELRRQHLDKTVTKAVDKISRKQADTMARIDRATDKLLTKIEKAIDELDLTIVRKKIKVEIGSTEVTTEEIEFKEDGIVDRAGLRQITTALKDIKEIRMIRSELDKQEQRARIANLQKQAEKDNDSGEVIVQMDEEVVDYSG